MESNDELKQIDIKNRTCYYFDDIIKIEDFNLDNILIDEKSYEKILVYNITHKNLIDSKPLRIIFDKIDGFIRVHVGTRYLVLLGSEKYDSICDRIRYLIRVKSGITYIISCNYPTIKVDSYDSLPLWVFCHYGYFLNKGFKFQSNVCYRCHDLLMKSMNLSDIAILNIKH